MATVAPEEPVAPSKGGLREQTSWVDVVAATVVAVAVAMLTPLASSVHPLIPVAVTPAVTALITVAVRKGLSRPKRHLAEDPSADRRGPPSMLHGGLVIAFLAALLGFAIALVLVTALDLARGRPLDESTLVGERIEIPDLTGERRSRALEALRASGLEPTQVSEPSTAVSRFRVVRTDPGAGANVRKGSTVSVVVSSGPPLVAVPSIEGRLLAEALTELEERGLTAQPPAHSADSSSLVTNVEPHPGTEIAEGSTVVLQTAPAVEVPELVGELLGTADGMLSGLGLKLKKVPEPAVADEPGTILDVQPGSGILVAKGSTIDLTVAALEVPDVSGLPLQLAKEQLVNAGFTGTIQVAPPDLDDGAVIATDPPARQFQFSRDIAVSIGGAS